MDEEFFTDMNFSPDERKRAHLYPLDDPNNPHFWDNNTSELFTLTGLGTEGNTTTSDGGPEIKSVPEIKSERGGRKKRKSKRKRRKSRGRKSKRRRKKTKRKRKSRRKTKKRKKRRHRRSRKKHGGASLEEIPADGDRQSANLIVRMLTNLESMERQTAIDEVVSAYNNRDRNAWVNYLANMNSIYGLLSESEEGLLVLAERREEARRERIADQTRIPLAAQKEEEATIGLAAQKIEEQEENNN